MPPVTTASGSTLPYRHSPKPSNARVLPPGRSSAHFPSIDGSGSIAASTRTGTGCLAARPDNPSTSVPAAKSPTKRSRGCRRTAPRPSFSGSTSSNLTPPTATHETVVPWPTGTTTRLRRQMRRCVACWMRLGDARRVDDCRRHGGPRRSVWRARRDCSQHLRLRHHAAHPAHHPGTVVDVAGDSGAGLARRSRADAARPARYSELRRRWRRSRARRLGGATLPARDLYAESFAPLLDFGWSPLRAIRAEGWKFIEAPAAELYAVTNDPAEEHDRARDESARTATMRQRLARYSTAATPRSDADQESRARLQALGYVGGGSGARSRSSRSRRIVARWRRSSRR